MKTKVLLITMLLLLIVGNVPAGEKVWMENFDKARLEAKESGKYLFLNFSGSDWCGWCKKLSKEVFSQEDFLSFADKNLVLVNLDFPKFKQQSSEIKEQNRKLLNQFGVRGFPTVVLLSPEGGVVNQTGYRAGGAAKYASHILELIQQYEAKE